MASFESQFPRILRFEGGYQNRPKDSANYCNGQLIGTKYGVSAEGFQNYFGRCPSVEEMQNLTTDIAREIAKNNYWDIINGDKIENQSVADLMFDYIWGSGQSQISNLKAIANQVNGKKLIVENDNKITDAEANIINNLNQELYFASLKEFRIRFFNTLAQSNPDKYAEDLHGWINRINKYTFVSDQKKK